ncbi:hypothetical protein B7486_11905 [cyanobacterium TDX16]|nr:hypothetical protein B7486_11905 [cyanobacterium TDX16]
MLKRAVWWSCPVWLCLASPAMANIIVQQLPDPFGGPASDTLFQNQVGQVVWQQEADNIILDAPAVVRQVSWWGFYGGSGTPTTPPPITETMRIRFYGVRPGDGLPDDNNVLLEEFHQDAVREATGVLVFVGGRPAEYRYQVNLTTPLSLEAATLYWLEIVQIGDVESAFRWETGWGIVPSHAFRNAGIPSWQLVTGNQAFELSTVPEPQSAALVGVVSLVFVRRRRGRLSPC